MSSMKPYLLLIASLCFNASAGIENCLNDARDSGYQINARPAAVCAHLIRNHPERVMEKSLGGTYQVVAYGNILYLSTFSPGLSPKPQKVEMLAGDETGLTKISRVFLHEKKKRILIQQNGNTSELLTFTTEYAANTAPLRHLRAGILKHASQVKLLDDADEIALMSRTQKNIKFINASADNVRYKGEQFKPKLLREIGGARSGLKDPKDVVVSQNLNEIYVLDTDRILIFDLNTPKDAVPKGSITEFNGLSDLVAIELGQDNTLVGLNKNGQKAKLK